MKFYKESTTRLIRRFVVSLFVIGVVLGLTASAQQQRQQPQTTIKIVPEKPTSNDEIKLELSGTFPDACVPEKESVKVTVEYNQVTVATSHTSDDFCDVAVSNWSLSVPVGKKLAAGPYRVIVLFRMTKEPPDYLLGMATFAVIEKSANTDQMGSQASSVPLTILSCDKARSDGPWVPGPLYGSSLNTSRSNIYRVALPGTTSEQVGDTVKIELESKDGVILPGYKFDHWEAVQDAEIKAGSGQPPQVSIHITGPNPLVKLCMEQTELPDLTVKINASVRRYTEREQVFCDVIVLTTVSNQGDGPAGLHQISDDGAPSDKKPKSTKRYGLGRNGGNDSHATKTDLLDHLRPGLYLFGAKVESLSIKEKDTTNNTAMFPVLCR
ncbi:hypothetical protein HYR54_01510 [Candidatus Acetothermia bacterium]|nr:hypothetical protein [Candidatus Acetothermia bacterium]